MKWKSDSKGNHFNDSKKPGISSTENSSPSNGSQSSSLHAPKHKSASELKEIYQMRHRLLLR